jgi:DNA-directed RNA polymerase specialized sigma24 family protein
MTLSCSLSESRGNRREDLNEILEHLNMYILDLARRKIPRTVIPQEVLDLEIDELVQSTRIKLWMAIQRVHITHLEAYARCIIRTESVNIVRRYKRTGSVSIDEDGDLHEGHIMVAACHGMQDPADEFEQEERLINYTANAVSKLLALPPKQQRAMFYALRERAADVDILVDALRKLGVDIDAMNWPEEKDEIQRIRASLSVARKKLRSLNLKYDLN